MVSRKSLDMNQSKQKVAILGVTGMLGSAVYSVLKDKHDLIVTYRSDEKLKQLYEKYGRSESIQTVQVDLESLYQDYLNGFQGKLIGPCTQNFLNSIKDCDWVINAVGIIKPHSLKDPAITMFINGALPHILSTTFGSKLIHITTDCVYDGTERAPYDENAPKRPVDLYGLSKLLGEPKKSLVIRTSIIGPELGDSKGGLLGWFLNQEEKQIKGFTNHLWNGITTKEFGKICDKLIAGSIQCPNPGIYHVFSTDVTKYEMVNKFKKKYGLDVEIEPFEAPVVVDRRLSTVQDLNARLQIPSFEQMIEELQ